MSTQRAENLAAEANSHEHLLCTDPDQELLVCYSRTSESAIWRFYSVIYIVLIPSFAFQSSSAFTTISVIATTASSSSVLPTTCTPTGAFVKVSGLSREVNVDGCH